MQQHRREQSKGLEVEGPVSPGDSWPVVTPTGCFWYYIASVVVYSHLTECAGADPGRHCGGSPCLSHCSLSAHESPLDCPKPATLLLYTHAHSYTHKYRLNPAHTDTLTIHQAVPANVPTRHRMQTLNRADSQSRVTQPQTGNVNDKNPK